MGAKVGEDPPIGLRGLLPLGEPECDSGAVEMVIKGGPTLKLGGGGALVIGDWGAVWVGVLGRD